MTAERYCTNCRVELARGTDTCSACGVYAGDVFDGVMPEERERRKRVALLFALLAVVAGSAWFVQSGPGRPLLERMTADEPLPAQEMPPIRVVGDRPGGSRRGAGAAISEAEAIRQLRRDLVATRGIKDECLAVMSRGYANGAYGMTVVNSCEQTRLGEWRVDGRSGQVAPATAGR